MYASLDDFLRQNTRCAKGLTDEDRNGLEDNVQHHSGGLIVLLRDLGDDWYVKMHDSWGDDGRVVVHRYNSADREADKSEWTEQYFDSGREALQAFWDTDAPVTLWPKTDEEREAFKDWQNDVATGDTPMGFRDWLAHQQDDRTAEHRREMSARMRKVAEALNEMLDYWTVHDLPGDFLSEKEYPFKLSLDEQVAEVDHAAELIAGAHQGVIGTNT